MYKYTGDIETLVSTYEGESSLFILRASLTMPLADLEFEISESGAGQVDRAVSSAIINTCVRLFSCDNFFEFLFLVSFLK
jgi:hypothetical protein